jgi:DNA-directed RNA polymerase subunit RPC12/RpoP
MWTCIRCSKEWSVEDAPPDIDDFGVHFMCPTCGRRNNLKNVGGESIVLMQIDEPDNALPTKQG